jgi:hypothetical protein
MTSHFGIPPSGATAQRKIKECARVVGEEQVYRNDATALRVLLISLIKIVASSRRCVRLVKQALAVLRDFPNRARPGTPEGNEVRDEIHADLWLEKPHELLTWGAI